MVRVCDVTWYGGDRPDLGNNPARLLQGASPAGIDDKMPSSSSHAPGKGKAEPA
jgi:hypothetical protein